MRWPSSNKVIGSKIRMLNDLNFRIIKVKTFFFFYCTSRVREEKLDSHNEYDREIKKND